MFHCSRYRRRNPSGQAGGLLGAFGPLDVATNGRNGGTGSELSISKRLAELMGGEIDVESPAGQGEPFRFRFGLSRAADTAVPPYPRWPRWLRWLR